MNKNKTPLKILKIGGQVFENQDDFFQLIRAFAAWDNPKILVHGGGKKASTMAQQLGIEPKMYNGRRITDDATLEVVVMVYAGWINRKIVSRLQSLECNALGMTGADLNSIEAHKRIVKEVDFGWAGDIDKVDNQMLQKVLELEITPVFCAITHDKKGQLLNTNADTIAASLAAALSIRYEVSLHYCFDRPGVLLDASDDTTVIKELSFERYEQYKAEGIIADGMLPKLDNAFDSLRKGVSEVVLGGVQNLGNGTKIKM
ncbi:MAG: acetylglutamate kinase [Bacteroidota bacterium]